MNGCTETGKRVQVLLSTYNGERYLREQLDSFVAQTAFDTMSVLIRDDGSSDGTCAILSEYAQRYGFVVEYGENVGITESYLWLLRHSDRNIEYFAFSDQDDVWLPDKIETALRSLDALDRNSPRLFASLSEIVDESLLHIGVSLQPRREVGFYNAMVQNACPGHTQVFDSRLRDILCRIRCPEDVLVIDWWVYLAAAAMGTIRFEPRILVRHRQHDDNAVGYRISAFSQFFIRLKRTHSGEAANITRQLRSFLATYEECLPEEYRVEILRFLSESRNFRLRLAYLCSTPLYRQTAAETAAVKILYIFGKYCLRDGKKTNAHSGGMP